MKTLLVGLGNPILGDDGVGWRVAEEVKKHLPLSPIPSSFGKEERGKRIEVDVEFLSLGGISLMEHLIGYERAILIDALASNQEPGTMIVSKLSEMPDYSAFHIASAHDTSLQNALKLGRAMGAALPVDVMVVGIVTNRVYDFSEELSEAVVKAVPGVVETVLDLLKQ